MEGSWVWKIPVDDRLHAFREAWMLLSNDLW
ncbi:hypothetical protein AYI69_g1554, partial [Smittium culicis]